MSNLSKSTNIFTITRGDYAQVTFDLNIGTTLNPIDPDISNIDTANAYLGVMEANMPFEKALIRKKITDLTSADKQVTFTFAGTDTLYILPGVYHYSVKLEVIDNTGTGNRIYTIIPRTKFIVEGSWNGEGHISSLASWITDYKEPPSNRRRFIDADETPRLIVNGTNVFEIQFGLQESLIQSVEWIFKKGLCQCITKYDSDIEITSDEHHGIIVKCTLADYESTGFKKQDQVTMQVKFMLTTGVTLYSDIFNVDVVPSLDA